ncbi:hypothetical protein HYV11_00850 [Candidatus Dependentiae bacterium]|nr:hypothetical protein [Candidatus Dependentiae bacterium]
MKKVSIAGAIFLVGMFVLKFGKIFLSFFTGGIISSVVIDPLLQKFVTPSLVESKAKEADLSKSSIEHYLELSIIKSLHEIEKKSLIVDQKEREIKNLKDIAEKHSGIFIAVCKHYFESEKEYQEFLDKNSIKMDCCPKG